MAGLGNYSISPALFGSGIIVSHHADKIMSREYESEAVFRLQLQKHDWQKLMMALVNLLALANKLFFAGYLRKEASRAAYLAITSAKTYVEALPKDSPAGHQDKLKFIIDVFPRFVSGARPIYDNPIIENLEVVQDYYDRYLKKYESFNNTELSA